MAALTLTPAERKSHRAGAHHLQPVVMIGADGLTPAVEREADRALSAHGLIKLRVLSDDRAAREALLATLADRLNAAPVQHIGKLLVLWRPLPPKAAAEPRDDRGAGPKLVKLVKFSKSGNHRAIVKKVKVLGNQRVTAGGLVKRAKKVRAGAGSVKRKATSGG
jgi:RNA-binding protein